MKQYVGMHIGELDDSYLGSGTYIRKAFKKYGKSNFVKEILEVCDNIEEAHLNEEKYIKEYNTLFPNGYNLDKYGGSIHLAKRGYKICEEGRKNMKLGAKKRPTVSKETRLKMRIAQLGKKQPDSQKEKYKCRKGRKASQKLKDSITKGWIKRKETPMSDETKLKMSLSKKGKKLSDEHKQKMREGWALKRLNKL